MEEEGRGRLVQRIRTVEQAYKEVVSAVDLDLAINADADAGKDQGRPWWPGIYTTTEALLASRNHYILHFRSGSGNTFILQWTILKRKISTISDSGYPIA